MTGYSLPGSDSKKLEKPDLAMRAFTATAGRGWLAAPAKAGGR
jgi:hypothetical protein